MKQIFKYAISPQGELLMPQGAQILTVQVQHGNPCIWAMVDTSQPVETRIFRCLPTGTKFDEDGLRYIGTFHLEDEMLVFHLFEVLKY